MRLVFWDLAKYVTNCTISKSGRINVYIRKNTVCSTLWEPAYDIFVLDFSLKNSNFRLPYQRHSSFANCAGKFLLFFHVLLNTLAPEWIQGFSKKKRLNARGFAREYLHSCTGYWPGRSIKRRDKSSSLHSKKIFWLGLGISCEWHHKLSNFGVILAHVAWPRAQLLGQSVSLKFALETRLKSESFEPLINFLAFLLRSYNLKKQIN